MSNIATSQYTDSVWDLIMNCIDCVHVHVQHSSHCPQKLTYSSSNDPPKRVPGSTVKPVEERVEAIHSHVVGGAIVEPANQQSVIE